MFWLVADRVVLGDYTFLKISILKHLLVESSQKLSLCSGAGLSWRLTIPKVQGCIDSMQDRPRKNTGLPTGHFVSLRKVITKTRQTIQ